MSELSDVLEREGVQALTTSLKTLHAQNPAAVAPLEAWVNRAGYELLGSGRGAEALALLSTIASLLPDSLHAQDSLGDAHLTLGNLDQAEACYREVLRRIAANPNLPAADRATYTQSAEAGLANIRKKRGR